MTTKTKISKTSSTTPSSSVKKENLKLVEAMLQQIENETAFWQKNWSGEAIEDSYPCNAFSGRKYRGDNPLRAFVFLLSKGYESPRFITFNQAFNELGLKFKADNDHKACSLYMPCISKSKETKINETGDEEETQHIFFKPFNVFSLDQFEITPEQWEKIGVNVKVSYEEQSSKRNELAEKLITRSKAKIISFDGAQPCFCPKSDIVEFPLDSNFENITEKYSVLFHELSHWTLTKDRTNRKEMNLSYPEEELVAELSSFMLCQSLGLHYSPSLEGQKNAYLKAWIENIGESHELRMQALGLALEEAQKASKFLLNFIKPELDEIDKEDKVQLAS